MPRETVQVCLDTASIRLDAHDLQSPNCFTAIAGVRLDIQRLLWVIPVAFKQGTLSLSLTSRSLVKISDDALPRTRATIDMNRERGAENQVLRSSLHSRRGTVVNVAVDRDELVVALCSTHAVWVEQLCLSRTRGLFDASDVVAAF